MSWRALLRFTRLAHEAGLGLERSLGAIHRLQRQRLRDLLAHTARHSPFYREKYRGIDMDRATLGDLPPITKTELRDNLDDVFTDRALTRRGLEQFASDESNLGKWYLGRYAVSHTSGSQGLPLWIAQERHCLELMFALMSARGSTSRQPGILEGLRRLARPRRVALVQFRRGFYPSGAALEFMREIVGPFVRLKRFSSSDPDLVDQLRTFQPQVISSYASTLEALAERSDELRLTDLQQLTNSSEQLTPRARARIESAFQTPVTDHYGAGECLWMADACPAPGGVLHINADWCIVEVVDQQGRSVPEGTLGARILVTNLANRVQPFVRYEIGDRMAVTNERCACGSQLPRIRALEGREAELFWVGGAERRRFISGVTFHTVADSFNAIREWQACQHSPDHIEWRVELLPSAAGEWAGWQTRLEAALRAQDWPEDVTLTVTRATRLAPDERTGKMRRMVRSTAAPCLATTVGADHHERPIS